MQKKGNLYKDIATLHADEAFVSKCRSMGLNTLEDVMKKGPSRLRKKPEFNILWYTDMLSLLDEQGLLEDYEKLQ